MHRFQINLDQSIDKGELEKRIRGLLINRRQSDALKVLLEGGYNKFVLHNMGKLY